MRHTRQERHLADGDRLGLVCAGLESLLSLRQNQA